MKKLILATILAATSTTAFANQTMYTWDAVTKRVDGTPVEHPVSYVVKHNGKEYPTTDVSLSVTDHPLPGTESCVSAIENYPSGLKLQSDWACVAINAKPSTPTFQIIQLINQQTN